MDKFEARENILKRVCDDLAIRTEPGTERLWGLHRSKIRGHGFDFAGHALYAPGEERFIDWAVYGRTKEKVIKRFREEKNIPIMTVTDLSPSMFAGVDTFFDFCTFKSEAAFAVNATLHHYADTLSDPIGYCLIDSAKETIFEPGWGENAYEGLDAIWEVIWSHEARPENKTDQGIFLRALEHFSHEYVRPALVCIISDFSETFLDASFNTLKKTAQRLTQSHEVIAIVIRSSWEYRMPESHAIASFKLNGEQFPVHFGSREERELYQTLINKNMRALKRLFEGTGGRCIFLETNDNILTNMERQLTLSNE